MLEFIYWIKWDWIKRRFKIKKTLWRQWRLLSNLSVSPKTSSPLSPGRWSWFWTSPRFTVVFNEELIMKLIEGKKKHGESDQSAFPTRKLMMNGRVCLPPLVFLPLFIFLCFCLLIAVAKVTPSCMGINCYAASGKLKINPGEGSQIWYCRQRPCLTTGARNYSHPASCRSSWKRAAYGWTQHST